MSRRLWLRNTLVATALLSVFSVPVSAATHTLQLAIGDEPTEGFDPMLGWSHGSYLLLHSPLLKQMKILVGIVCCSASTSLVMMENVVADT